MPADSQRIQSIFLAAIKAADPSARAAVLARECGNDAELRQRVEMLLQAHDRSGSFLDKPAVEPVTTDEPAGHGEGLGQRLRQGVVLSQGPCR